MFLFSLSLLPKLTILLPLLIVDVDAVVGNFVRIAVSIVVRLAVGIIV